MPEGRRLPAWVDAPPAGTHIERALRRLLRGGTWEALANEIALEAVRATGAELSCLEWLPGLIEAMLSEHVDGLEFVLEPARVSAFQNHLEKWPNDVAGAETAATLAAADEADRLAGRLYLDVLEWALALLDRRLAQPRTGSRPRLPSLRRTRPPAEPEVPAIVAESLTKARPAEGWEEAAA